MTILSILFQVSAIQTQLQKINKLDPSINTNLEPIDTKPSQVYLKRRTTTIEPVHTQDFESRPSNSSISPSTLNVDNDLNLPIVIRKGTRQCTQHSLSFYNSS